MSFARLNEVEHDEGNRDYRPEREQGQRSPDRDRMGRFSAHGPQASASRAELRIKGANKHDEADQGDDGNGHGEAHLAVLEGFLVGVDAERRRCVRRAAARQAVDEVEGAEGVGAADEDQNEPAPWPSAAA